MLDLEEAISLFREALTLRPRFYPDSSATLNGLQGKALMDRYLSTGTTSDLEEAISHFRNALALRPSPHPRRLRSLSYLIISLRTTYGENGDISHLQEAILHCHELLALHYPVGHGKRAKWLSRLTFLLQMRFDATRREEDLVEIGRLKEEVNQLSTSTST